MKTKQIVTSVLVFIVSIFISMSYSFAENEQIKEMPATQHLDSIVLGAGCFWGAEKRYQSIPGVINAISGYAGGNNIKPHYEEIIKSKNKFNKDNHAEVVKVIFNTTMVSLETILQSYFEGHDPTQLNRQGNDVGTQYRSIILTNTEQQAETAQKLLTQYQSLLSSAGFGAVVTIIEPLQEFFKAEEYHQDYLVKNPKGYCPDHSTGIKFNAEMDDEKIVNNDALTQGKQIVVIEADYCPYCEKFKKDVLNNYQGSIPQVSRFASQLQGLTIKSPTWATPTILFLEDGVEVYGHQGYMTAIQFYRQLGAFQLGKSEAFNVAFEEGTDAKYCKQYEIFKHTPDGVFVDKLSGAPLFDTRDRFNSASGWLSFTKAIGGATYEKADNRYGMERIEIRSKTSDIHLGHVFPDGPNGKPRFCINATVLDFKARAKS